MSRPEMRNIFRACRRMGLHMLHTKTHVKIFLPQGGFVTCSCTPSDRHAYKNVIKDLRRAGVDIKI